MYVVVFEVLQREKSKEKVPGLVQLFCVMLGFSALMLVEILGKYKNELFVKLLLDKRIKCTFTKTTQLILAPHEHGGDEEGVGSTAGAFTNTGVITSLAM